MYAGRFHELGSHKSVPRYLHDNKPVYQYTMKKKGEAAQKI